MGNQQPPQYTEKSEQVPAASQVPLFPSTFRLQLQDGPTTCQGSIGPELYDLISHPRYGYIYRFSDGTIYYQVPLYVSRLNKAFKKLVSMKVTPGDYNVKITLSWEYGKSASFNCRMDLASCIKLKKIVHELRPSIWEEERPFCHARQIDINASTA